MPKFKSLVGKKFGKLEVISFSYKNNLGKAYWLCKCDCGKKIITSGSNLVTGQSKSCGCFRSKLLSVRRKKHGQSETKLYNVWRTIKSRCLLPSTISYERYGGRGIKICEEWKEKFEPFWKWAIENGYKDGLTIDRIDNDGDYCPENCRWVDRKEQAKNRRTTVFYLLNGEKICLNDLLKKIGFSKSMYWRNKKRGCVEVTQLFKGVDFNKFKIERID